MWVCWGLYCGAVAFVPRLGLNLNQGTGGKFITWQVGSSWCTGKTGAASSGRVGVIVMLQWMELDGA